MSTHPSLPKTAQEKNLALRDYAIQSVNQLAQLSNPDSRVSLSTLENHASLLSEHGDSFQGLVTGDLERFVTNFWEHQALKSNGWEPFRTTIDANDSPLAGVHHSILWESGDGQLAQYAAESRERLHDMHESGNRAWGRKGVAINRMRGLRVAHYFGEHFDNNVAVVVPKKPNTLGAIWCYLSSSDFFEHVRQLDTTLKVTNKTLLQVPFDLTEWELVSNERYPNGLPQPYSEDVTQWTFHGHPQKSTDPLQVAVARLLGYTWPSETDDKMELSDEARAWIAHSKALASQADEDGIVCIPPVGPEASASDRLLNLLADAYGTDWSNDVLAQLLSAADHAGKSLETWLRDKFFIQHCALFGNRPFVWHVWDGLRDGFSALVNYHKLDYKTLEALIYTYLGDWIGRQRRDAESGVDGAQEKLAAAETLKKRLELVLAGEAPYDIFVRWKPIEEQPIGWHPDLNDGVRMNIRPFLSVPDVGKRGAGVLRDKPKSLHWEKDRGSDVLSAPWYELGLQYGGKVGDRINDHHLSLAEKRAAREKAK